MSVIRSHFIQAARAWSLCVIWAVMAFVAPAQTVNTTTVQGTVYLANGAPGSGTMHLSWPAFTTASNQAVAAGKLSVKIGADGFMSVNLAPNLGSSPAGLYYTAIYHLSDGTTSTEYRRIESAELFGVFGCPHLQSAACDVDRRGSLANANDERIRSTSIE